jgi:hypothetical protein
MTDLEFGERVRGVTYVDRPGAYGIRYAVGVRRPVAEVCLVVPEATDARD